MESRRHIKYFADENALGFAKLMVRVRDDIVHPGHPMLPEVPLGTPDPEWLEFIGKADWIVLTRDKRIRTRPAELAIYRSYGVRSVWLGGKRDQTAGDLVLMFERHELRLTRLVHQARPRTLGYLDELNKRTTAAAPRTRIDHHSGRVRHTAINALSVGHLSLCA